MKYLLTLISALLLFPLSSCSDGDDMPFRDELSGTVWSQKIGYSTHTFYFGIRHECTYDVRIEGWKPISRERTYTYSAPEVSIIAWGHTVEATGRIEGNVLKIHYDDEDLVLEKIR